MELIDTIAVQYQGKERMVMLFVGDLACLPEHEAVDLLIVSAFPNEYLPTSNSLIGHLDRVGISVADLAQHKEVDLRNFSSCWLSRPINRSDLHFERIMCFEPGYRGKAPEVVGDIFRSIFPFTTGSRSISQVAMPLVASGSLGESAEIMLEALSGASVHWLSNGLPLDRIKIVLHDSANLQPLSEIFSRVKKLHSEDNFDVKPSIFSFDVFISYSQKNKDAVDALVRELQARRPALRIFLDRLELQPGAAWQQHIFESLDKSRKVICAFSPEYLASKICKEEFNIALLRHRESDEGVLLPVYLNTADLPTYMKLIHYEDVRENDHTKITQSAERIIAELDH